MLIKPGYWTEFFRGDTTYWFRYNHRREIGKLENLNWKLTFDEAIRRIWLRRNAWIFNKVECDLARLYWSIIIAAREFENSSEVLKFSGMSRSINHVVWQPPGNGWLKCNVDGVSKCGGHGAGCGDVIKDSTGNWIMGFALRLDDMGSLSAKLWSILKGLELAWERKYRQLVVESDAREAIDLIKRSRETSHPLDSLIRKTRHLVNREWEVVLSHTYREGNKVANHLALSARNTECGWRLLEGPPEELRCLLQNDLKRSRTSRGDGPVG